MGDPAKLVYPCWLAPAGMDPGAPGFARAFQGEDTGKLRLPHTTRSCPAHPPQDIETCGLRLGCYCPVSGLEEKVMRSVAILALDLIFVAGCGTNVGTNLAAGVSLAEARATCLAWLTVADSAALFDVLVLVAEAGRDDGRTEPDFLVSFLPSCSDDPDIAGCSSCFTQIGAAVWN